MITINNFKYFLILVKYIFIYYFNINFIFIIYFLLMSSIWNLLFMCFFLDVFLKWRLEKQIKQQMMNNNQTNNFNNNLNNKKPNINNIEDDNDKIKNEKNEEDINDKKENNIKNNNNFDDEDDDADLPTHKKKPKKGKEFRNKKILIKYDKVSYQKFFEQFKKDLEGNFTEYKVIEEEYPVSPNKKFLSKYTFMSQMIISGLVFGSSMLKGKIPIPDIIFDTINNNKLMIGIGNFIFHKWLNNYLTTTGAFEIYLNDKILYSKLHKRILPKILDIKHSIDLL